MKLPLGNTYRSRIGHWTILKRIGNICLAHCNDYEAGWEVFRVVTKPAHHRSNHPEGTLVEHVPASSQWGSQGWSYQTPEDAETRFQSLLHRQAQKATATLEGSDAPPGPSPIGFSPCGDTRKPRNEPLPPDHR